MSKIQCSKRHLKRLFKAKNCLYEASPQIRRIDATVSAAHCDFFNVMMPLERNCQCRILFF